MSCTVTRKGLLNEIRLSYVTIGEFIMFDGVNKSLPFRKILLTFTSEIFFFWLKDELKGHFTSEVVVLE